MGSCSNVRFHTPASVSQEEVVVDGVMVVVVVDRSAYGHFWDEDE